MATSNGQEIGWQEVSLLLVSIALGALDFVLTGVAVAFGPTGFGGDGPVTSRDVTVANLGEAAGVAGCALVVVAFVILFVQRSARTRRRILVAVFAAQLAATTALAASMAAS